MAGRIDHQMTHVAPVEPASEPRRHFGPPIDIVPAPLQGPSLRAPSSNRRPTVYSFEWLVIGITLMGICIAPWLPINPGKLALDRIVQALSIAFLNVLALRAILPVSSWWRNRKSSDHHLWSQLRAAYSPSYVAYVVRAALAIQITLLWFCSLKYVVPYFRPGIVDGALWHWDSVIHGGISPSALAVSLTEDAPHILQWTDWFYVGYFPILLLFFAYVMIQERKKHLRDAFVFGYCLFWLLGGLSYYVLPSMGPIYHQPLLFSGVMEQMPFASKLNHELLMDYRAFIAAPWQHEPMLYYGIAAMPSLHVGACAMFACFARHFGRIPFALMATVTVLMFLGSVITGWHYAIDGYAGALLGWLAYRIAIRMVAPPKDCPHGPIVTQS